MTKQMRMHYILNLAMDAKRFLDKSSMFDANNLVIAYRCAPNQDGSQMNEQ